MSRRTEWDDGWDQGYEARNEDFAYQGRVIKQLENEVARLQACLRVIEAKET